MKPHEFGCVKTYYANEIGICSNIVNVISICSKLATVVKSLNKYSRCDKPLLKLQMWLTFTQVFQI